MGPRALLSLSAMAATRSSRPPAATGSHSEIGDAALPPGGLDAPKRESERLVSGPVRAGRRTKLLVKRLGRGEIALVDHLDIDRVSAEELIAAGAVAVLNCKASSGGSYPNLGPQLL